MDVPTVVKPEIIGESLLASPDLLRPCRVHLIGVAGSGMRALADVLAGWGWRVSGSDCTLDGAMPLGNCGLRLFQGHAAEQVPADTELVVYSDAVPAANPELRRAAELGIPAISYFQMLGQLTAGGHTVAVAGTHGKSTVTAMTAHILVEAGCDPTVFCGATPVGRTSGGLAGGQNLLREGERHTECACYDGLHRQCAKYVVEACEYRANFLHLRPQHAAVLGIEPDHFDCYGSLDELELAFRQFAALVPTDGLLLVRHDCPSTRRATAGMPCRVESLGLCAEADWFADVKPRPVVAVGRPATTGRGFTFEVRRFGEPICEVQLRTPGRHNVLNALAAAALAWHNSATADQIAAGLGSFAGLHRRLELLGEWQGVALVDDYAHHPTEVTSALETVRSLFPHRRVWCVFQPHQSSRTARLLDQFAASLQNADRVLVAEIFRAREGDPQPGEVTAADLARRVAELGVEVIAGHGEREIVSALETGLVAGDVLVTLGAGDVWRFRPKVRNDDTKEERK
jgi:UDP-N-acetylmuramate--alanine ligase